MYLIKEQASCLERFAELQEGGTLPRSVSARVRVRVGLGTTSVKREAHYLVVLHRVCIRV